MPTTIIGRSSVARARRPLIRVSLTVLPFDDVQGVGVASTGQVFTTFPRGNETYTLATFTSTTTEEAWPK